MGVSGNPLKRLQRQKDISSFYVARQIRSFTCMLIVSIQRKNETSCIFVARKKLQHGGRHLGSTLKERERQEALCSHFKKIVPRTPRKTFLGYKTGQRLFRFSKILHASQRDREMTYNCKLSKGNALGKREGKSKFSFIFDIREIHLFF